MTTLKMMKKRELGVLVEFYSEVFDEIPNIRVVGNQLETTTMKIKKLSCGHLTTWFAKDDWDILRPLFLRMQEHFLLETDKHETLKFVGLDKCSKKSLKDRKDNALGTKILVYSQKRRKGQRLLDTEMIEEIWISNEDYAGLDLTHGSHRESILFRLNILFQIRSGRQTSIKLEQKK